MSEMVEVVVSSPVIQELRTGAPATSGSPSQALHSQSLAGTPIHGIGSPTKTPKSPFAARIMTPIASPMKKAIESMQGCLEEIGHFTRLDPQEAWLPITESRNGNAYYAAFHTLSSGIGVQALVLPLAFTSLGWTWGIVCLSLAFAWQLYTLWLLIQLHESVPGMRYSRYLWLSMAAFGNKLGKILALFPTMYLSGGTCVTLIIIGGGAMKMFVQIVCERETTGSLSPLTMTEWYLLFTVSAIILAQLPNLNSIAGVSLIGAITAVSYCTMIWVVSLTKDRPLHVSYEPVVYKSEIGRICSILNALGIIAFAFRGHNLVLEIQVCSNCCSAYAIPSAKNTDLIYYIKNLLPPPLTFLPKQNLVIKAYGGYHIPVLFISFLCYLRAKDFGWWKPATKLVCFGLLLQGTMPSSLKHPSRLPMWKGVKVSYLIIALCLFPLAIGGYWAYGDLIPSNGGIMSALYRYRRNDTSKVILGFTSLFIVLNSLTSFQIYAMPVFDNLEFRYTSNNNRPCPWWLRAVFRMFFGCLAFFIAVALPFLPSLAGLIGGITLPLTLAYPCIMWIIINKPGKHSTMWYLNWSLGFLGIVLSILLVFGAIWTIVTQGIEVHFFKP